MDMKRRRTTYWPNRVAAAIILFCVIGIAISQSRRIEIRSKHLEFGLTGTALWMTILIGDEADIVREKAEVGQRDFGFYYRAYSNISDYWYFLSIDRLVPSVATRESVPAKGFDKLIGVGPNISNPIRTVYFTLPLLFIILIITIGVIVINWRNRHRVRRGACSTCYYNITGSLSGICPECGTPIHSQPH